MTLPQPDHAQDPKAVKGALRRQLLKGLIAGLPAVITLQSGAARALSSLNQCYLQETNKPSKHCLRNEVPAEYDGANFIGPPYGNLTLTKGRFKMLLESNYGGGNDVTGDGQQDDLCVVYVDGNGSVAGAGVSYGEASANGPPAAGYYAMSVSCWTSLIGNP
ncbi:MAG: hypothetical protein G8345_03875 [Magnetococcales bacterium]|nr:hypothetical protein [Magnetococcales bacterium]NGZ26010.1 hypothetical protein [Magnetococcales bacterium]